MKNDIFNIINIDECIKQLQYIQELDFSFEDAVRPNQLSIDNAEKVLTRLGQLTSFYDFSDLDVNFDPNGGISIHFSNFCFWIDCNNNGEITIIDCKEIEINEKLKKAIRKDNMIEKLHSIKNDYKRTKKSVFYRENWTEKDFKDEEEVINWVNSLT